MDDRQRRMRRQRPKCGNAPSRLRVEVGDPLGEYAALRQQQPATLEIEIVRFDRRIDGAVGAFFCLARAALALRRFLGDLL